MKTVKLVPGTKMSANLKALESGDKSVLEAITTEATSVLKSEGYEGNVAVMIGDVIPEEVPTRVVAL